MDLFDKFNDTKLPWKDEFDSILNDEQISDKDYQHPETVEKVQVYEHGWV